MNKAKIEMLQDSYKLAFKRTTEEAEKFPAELRLSQAKSGKAHALWEMGHLAFALDVVVNSWLLGGKSVLPANYAQKFGPTTLGGNPVSAQASAYPSWDEVLANYRKVSVTTIDLLGNINDADLPGPALGPMPEQAKGFFSNLGTSLIGMMQHDAHHRGQMAMLKGITAKSL